MFQFRTSLQFYLIHEEPYLPTDFRISKRFVIEVIKHRYEVTKMTTFKTERLRIGSIKRDYIYKTLFVLARRIC